MGFITRVANNFIPTALIQGQSGNLASDATRAVLSAAYPSQYESFEITLKLIYPSAASTGSLIKSFTFPVMPEALNIAQKYLATITPTLGGVFVDDFGRAPSPIVLMGTFGKRVRAVEGIGLTSNIIATGYGSVKNLSEFVEDSHKAVNGKLPRVILYNWTFNSHWEVVINGFNVQMSTQQNNIWVYQLQLVTLRQYHTTFRDSKDRIVGAIMDGALSGTGGKAAQNVAKAVLVVDTARRVVDSVMSVRNRALGR